MDELIDKLTDSTKQALREINNENYYRVSDAITRDVLPQVRRATILQTLVQAGVGLAAIGTALWIANKRS